MANRNCAVSPAEEALSIQLETGEELEGWPHVPPLPEAVFVKFLRLERRRTERSGRPFLLVLISSEELQASANPALVGKITVALSSCIRETDILGWYRRDATLALLMTELGPANSASIDAIASKISVALGYAVSPETFRRLEVQYRIFPQDPTHSLCETGDTAMYPDLTDRHDRRGRKRFVKRAMDIAGSLVALILFSPLFAVIALLVKATSKGPVLFSQKRVGQYHREFTFFKFRTMYVGNDPLIHQDFVAKLIAGKDAREKGDGVYKLVNDPRITPLGRILRKTSLDELPQFVNVLLNDMSLVGPRPPLPYEYNLYKAWHRRRVMEIKPGITGLWQIKGRSRTTFDEMVRMDLRYSRTDSFGMDLKIVLQTPAAMFSGRGAC